MSKKQTRAKAVGTSMMFVNSCMGASILTLGYRFNRLGLPLGMVYLGLAFGYSVWAFREIIKVCYYGNVHSLEHMIRLCWGRAVALVVDISTLLMLLGVLIVFLIVASDYVYAAYALIVGRPTCDMAAGCDVYNACIAEENQTIMYIRLIVGLVVFMAETFIPNLDFLNTVSSFSLVFVLFTLFCVIGRAIEVGATGKLNGKPFVTRVPAVPVRPEVNAVLTNLPAFFSLFSLQCTLPPVYSDLRGNRSSKRRILNAASDTATVLVMLMYCVMGITACLVFYGPNQGEAFQKDNVLNNFASDDILMTVVRCGYGLVILVAYPCVFYCVRFSLMAYCGFDTEAKRKTPKGRLAFYGFGVGIDALVVVGAVVIPSIVVAFDVFAALFGVILYQLLPLITSFKLPAIQARDRYRKVRRREMRESGVQGLEETSTVTESAGLVAGPGGSIRTTIPRRPSAPGPAVQERRPSMRDTMMAVGSLLSNTSVAEMRRASEVRASSRRGSQTQAAPSSQAPRGLSRAPNGEESVSEPAESLNLENPAITAEAREKASAQANKRLTRKEKAALKAASIAEAAAAAEEAAKLEVELDKGFVPPKLSKRRWAGYGVVFFLMIAVSLLSFSMTITDLVQVSDDVCVDSP